MTEEEAKQSGRKVDVEVYPWAASGRAQALGITNGLTKWLVDPESHRVVGCGIAGSGAGELIAEAGSSNLELEDMRPMIRTLRRGEPVRTTSPWRSSGQCSTPAM